MATRRSEWFASIKPILDRDEIKNDAVALAKELSNILEIKIDANPENLSELAKEFNAQLKNMGKQPIVFSEKTLSGIVSQFTKAISAGISAGVAKVDFSAELTKLNKQREEILSKQAQAQKNLNARTRMDRLEEFRLDTANLMPINENTAKEAEALVEILYTSADRIDEAAKKYGKSSLHYASAVMDAQEAYNKYLRMQKTMGQMGPSQLSAIPKDVRASYDMLGQERYKYEASGGYNIPFEDTASAEKILDSFEMLSDVFEKSKDDTVQLDKQLKQIDTQIEEITRKMRDSGGVENGILKGAKDGLKTLNEIEAAYKRLKIEGGAKLRSQSEAHINSALNFDPSASKVGIKSLANDYYKAAASGDWVEEYNALLKYVRLYESYLTSTNQTHRNKVTANNNPFTPLYEQLKPMADNARNMLQNIINMGAGTPLVGMGGTTNENVKIGATPEDVDNTQKVASASEKTAQADNAAANAIKQKRIEAERIVVAANQVANAAERELNANKESQKYIGYRALQPPSGSGKTKADAFEDWGAEYFSTSKDVAASYGEDFWKKGDIVIGEITPKNPLIINANGARWDEFEKMPDINKAFPELASLIKSNPNWTGDDKQRYINNRAKAMGHDAVVLENVNDALDGDKKSYELSTTIAVLDDTIVRLTGSMSQLEAGTNRFSDTISSKIPSYYEGGQRDGSVVFGSDKAEPTALAGVKQGAAAAKQAVDALNESLATTHQTTSGGGTGANAGGASLEELEQVRAQAESLLKEIAQKDSVIAAKNKELEFAQQSNANVRNQLLNTGKELEAANQRANAAEERAAKLEQRIAGSSGDNKKQGSVNTEELRTLLNSLVYNVKIAYDDNDKTDNKIIIDEASLTATLNKVFANILNPSTQQNDSEQKNSWALESTLQTVKGVLNGIQTNTAKIGTVDPSQENVTSISVLDSRLAEIKMVLDSINQKIIDGGVIFNRGGAKQAYQDSKQDSESKQTGQSTTFKSLQKDYEYLGRLSAQFANDGNLETKAMIDNLNEEISRKRQLLQLTMDENASLREKYIIARNGEKRLLDAAKAQKVIDDQRKAADKNAKQKEKAADKAWKDRVKDAQRRTGINAADSVYRSANDTVFKAIGTEGISGDIENKARELSNQIDALKVLRDKIEAKGERASEKNRDALSKQVAKVKELKSEMEGYLTLHEKYSGKNAKTITGNASEFNGLDLETYKQKLTSAVMAATNGQARITGFNNTTKELSYTVKTGRNEFTSYTAAVDQFGNRLATVAGQMKRTESIFSAIARKTKQIFTYFSGSSLIFRFFNIIKKGIQSIKDIDSALTELKKVTDETEETYDKFLETASKTAGKIGSTIKEVVSSTADFARLGYSLKEAAMMAESAQILMNVSEFTDVSTATDTLISSIQAFKYTAEESMDVVDILNTIGNNYAISTADLAQSLTKSSGSLVAANGTLEEAVALTATANTIIQDSDAVGTALKTVAMRLRGTSVEELQEEGIDADGAVESKSKLQSKIKALAGVDILTDAGAYKSTYQILSEIANVWEDINDMDQAALLELLAGKRAGSVMSAILQNPEILKDAFESAQDAEGSALKENETYLDSIQGKIDQFNNAVQSLWQNLLGSDAIKYIVEWGTEVIKSLDTVKGKLLALVKVAAILMAYKKVNPFIGLVNFGKAIKADGLVTTLKNMGVSLLGLRTATQAVTAETVANTIATQTNNVADQQAILQKIGLAGATGTLNAATKETIAQNIAKLVTDKAMTVQMGQQTAAMLGYTLSVDSAGKATVTLDATTKSFMASNPVGWILLIVSAVVMLVSWLSNTKSEVEKLTEELNDLKSELQDIQTELDSVNSELKTTQERMSELLAKDKLTFTEKEELNNLKKQNDELQRRLDLLDLEKKQKSTESAEKFNSTMQKDIGLDFWGGKGSTWENGEEKPVEYVTVFDAKGNEKFTGKDVSWGAFWNELWWESLGGGSRKFLSETEYLDKQISDYQNASEDDKKNIESVINSKFDEWEKAADGLDYGIDEETDEWLDFIYNYQDKWAIASGGDNAKTNALSRIFNKDENAALKESIDGYVEALEKGDLSAKGHIEEIIKNNAKLVADLEASGLKVDDAVAYFTSFASEANFATIEGKVKEIDEATKRLQASLSGFDTSSLDSIKQALTDKGWVDAEGNLMSDAIAEYFGGEGGGISEETRAEIERLVKQIYDGKISVQDALKSFELFGIQSVIDIQVAEVKTNFKDVFIDLEDADGLINTFKELGEAIGGTVGALEAFNQAQADVADKGFVSIQTALQLMEYTDDYGSVLQVVDGKLQLVENAEENLIQARINAIRVSAQTAVADAQAAYDKAELAVQSYRSAMVEEISASTVATAWQKIVATAAGIKNALANIWSGQSIGDLYNSGYNTYLESATGYETKYDNAGLQALEDALADSKKKLDEAKGNAEIANAMTAEGLEDLHKSSDKKTKEDVADDAFQREMDYWENRIAANQAKYEQLQNEIDLLETKGQKADASYYQEQMKIEEKRLKLLNGQKKAAQSYLDTLTEGSEEWWEVASTLNSLESDIDDVTASIVDLQDAIGEIDTYKFEEFGNRLDNITSKLETIRNLIAPDGEEDWFDDNGDWTEAGVAVLGSHIQQLEMYKQGYQNTMDELAKYESPYAGNEDYYDDLGIHSEQEYYCGLYLNQQYVLCGNA